MTKTRLALAVIIIAVIGAVFALGIDDYLTLEKFRAQQSEIQTFVADHYSTAVAIFFFTYVTVTALSIPGAAVMTLIGGALFGLISGTIIISFASTIGATSASQQALKRTAPITCLHCASCRFFLSLRSTWRWR